MNEMKDFGHSCPSDAMSVSPASVTALSVNRLYVNEPEFGDFRSAMTAVARAARAAPACLLFEVAADDDDGALLVVERWRTEGDQQAFVQQEDFSELIAAWRPRIESETLISGQIEEAR